MSDHPYWFIVIVILATVVFVEPVYAGKIERVNATEPVADFQLQDQHGAAFTREQLIGKWSLVFSGFTSCPDVCPYTLATLEAARTELSLRITPEKMPRIIFLAVDPARDKSVLADYLDYFNSEFIGLTGSKSQIDTAAGALGFVYRFEPSKKTPGEYSVSHSSAVILLDTTARIVARLYPPFPAQTTATTLYRLIQGLPHEGLAHEG